MPAPRRTRRRAAGDIGAIVLYFPAPPAGLGRPSDSSAAYPRVGGSIEPNPRAARARAARARSGHSPAAGEVQEEVRRRHQSRATSRRRPSAPAPSPWYPDLVLHSTERGRRLAGVVEVETAESVNNLEAMSQWAAFAKQRARVPPLRAGVVDRRDPAAVRRHRHRRDRDLGVSLGRRPAAVRAGAARRGRRSKPSAQGREGPGAKPRQGCRRQAGGGRREAAGRRQGRRAKAGGAKNGCRKNGAPRTAPEDAAKAGRHGSRAAAKKARPRQAGRQAGQAPLDRRAVPAGHPRQARVRDHLPDALVQRRRAAALADPLRLPRALGGARRAACRSTGRRCGSSRPASRGGVRLEGGDGRAPGDRVGARDPPPPSAPRGEPARAATGRSRAAAGRPPRRRPSAPRRFPRRSPGTRRRAHGVSGRVVSDRSRARGAPHHRRGAARRRC